MPKAITEIKEASNQLARRAKLGQLDTKTLIVVLNDVVNYLAAQATPPPAPGVDTAVVPAPVVTATSSAENKVGPAETSVADAVAPKRRRRKGVTIGNQSPATPAVTVGTKVPEVVAPAPSKGAAAEPAEKSPSTTANSRTLPLNVKPGKGVTVGTKPTVNTRVTVGSAPTAPAGQVTVGGRPRKS